MHQYLFHIGDFPIDNQGMVKLNANSRVRFQYRVQQLAKDGELPLTVVRQGAPLKIKVPVSAAHPMLISGLQGSGGHKVAGLVKALQERAA